MADARLPAPGEDSGTWGEILNEFLLVAHNPNGTAKLSSTLSDVATSGSYNDLADKPAIPAANSLVYLSGAQQISGEKDFTGNLKASGSTVVTTDDARLTNSRTPSDDSVSATKLQDDSVTEPKLAISNAPSNGNFLGWDGSSLRWQDQAAAPVTSVSGRTGAVTLAKGDVGLDDVDNTSDANKMVSIAVQAALNEKADLTDTRFTNTRTPTDNTVATAKVQNDAITEPKLAIANSPSNGNFLAWDGSSFRWQDQAAAPVTSVSGRTGVITLSKSDVGLANVDNTSDVNKPMSTATKTYVDNQVGGTQSLVIGTTAPTPATGNKVLWLNTSGGNVTLNLVTGD